MQKTNERVGLAEGQDRQSMLCRTSRAKSGSMQLSLNEL